MNKNILVTGGAGFVAFYLAKFLADNTTDKVTVIDNLSRGRHDAEFSEFLTKPNVRFIEADMTNTIFYSQLDNHYDEIYHLAAINGTKYFYEKPQEVLRVNILSLMNLLEWSTPENTGKLVFTSSSEAYAGTVKCFGEYKNFMPSKEDIPLTIDDVFNARFSYGGSKLIGELLTVNYLRTKKVPFSIIRYHNIYAGRMGFEHVLPEFCKRIANKENPFKIFGGTETRAFCYVDDAVEATVAVMRSEKCNTEVIHVGNSKEEITIKELAEKLFTVADYKCDFDIQPAPEGSVNRRCPDTTKLKELTGFEAKINLKEGLKKTLDWYLKKYTEMKN